MASIIKNCNSSSSILLIVFILFIHLHIHFAKPTKQDSSCMESELKALREFKGSLIDNENVLSSWTGHDCCSWYGITCNNLTGFVTSLDLGNVNDLYSMGGEINSSLVNLEHLEYLDLSYNRFEGLRIPAFLGSFRNLQYLNLVGAGFIGEIPQQLGNLSNLQLLYLGAYPEDYKTSYLLGSKSLNWITGLSSLKELQLYSVNLSESVDWLDSVNMLSSLSSLRLLSCELATMSMSSNTQANLTSLVSLDLGYNHLNFSFPPIQSMFAKMTTLTRLEISKNSLSSSFLDLVCNLTALNYLDLSDSDLQGSLPVCLGNLTSLTTLILQENKLSGEIPGELGYTRLTNLDLSHNLFNSSIPSSFGQLKEMERLILASNKLSGTVPSTLRKLAKLRYLDVSKNSLTGELTESFFKELKSLLGLSISRNQFLVFNVSSQWVPPFQIQSLYMGFVFKGTQFLSWLQTQRNLEELVLSNGNISGDIPNWCQTSYPNLSYFDLSNNFLSGSVPTFDVINNASFYGLVLSNNNISGNIPEQLCNLKSLEILSLSNNQLTGRIPLCLGNLWQLRVLHLANNSLYGRIPNELGYLEQLVVLHLNRNKFFGELPSSFQNLTLLEILDLGVNELNGSIPAWMGKEFSNMQYLTLQSNNFSGQITVNLCQLQSLQILNLAENNLVGTIPPCLANLSMMSSKKSGQQIVFSDDYDRLLNTVKGRELEYSSGLEYAKFISLSSNHLHGEIPDELMDLKGLQSLNLSNNDLSGRIPRNIGNLKELESLDLSMNRLTGTIPQSLANIDALSYLNLSFNNLIGRIPTGNHVDTLYNPFVYEGNSGVCGKQLARSCPGDLVTSDKLNGIVFEDDDNVFELSSFYGGIGTGFAIGFFGVMCLLYFNKSWRSAYFDSLENVYYKGWVAFATKIPQYQRKFN